MKPAQQSVHWTGGYAAHFQAFLLAQSSSATVALSPPSRQPVTQAVETVEKVGQSRNERFAWQIESGGRHGQIQTIQV